MIKPIRLANLAADIGFVNKKTLFVTDEKIWQNCREFFADDCSEILILKDPQADEKTLKKISNKADAELIIALGSGTINDLCKLVSAQKNIPYLIIASAASMNGYLSKNASITINGHKKTLPATLPLAVFCDVRILAKAPVELTRAGIGDIMCFYSCWFDWYLSHLVLGTEFNAEPFLMLKKKFDSFVKNFAKYKIDDEKFLEMLMEMLLLSGLGMTKAGGSYPASQSEHLIAHCLDMKYGLKNLHGAQIAVTTFTSLKLQKKILQQKTPKGSDPFLKKGSDPFGFFGKKIAQECEVEYLKKFREINISEKNWEKYKKKLAKLLFDEKKLCEIFRHFKIGYSVESLGVTKEQYQECVVHAKFIRNRFTCLDFV